MTPRTEVLQILRKEVGFGCPIDDCGSPFLTWHHFDPPQRVKEHNNPDGMIALCRKHHDFADAGHYTNEQLHRYKRSKSNGNGIIQAKFPWMRNNILLIVCNSAYIEPNIILRIKGNDIFYFSRDDEHNLLLNYRDVATGHYIIRENFWMVPKNSIQVVCPPSAKRLDVIFTEKKYMNVHFEEITSVDHGKKKFPDAPDRIWQYESISYPINVIEFNASDESVGYKMSNSGFYIGENNFPLLRGSIFDKCHCIFDLE